MTLEISTSCHICNYRSTYFGKTAWSSIFIIYFYL